jgi:hypothetical protein
MRFHYVESQSIKRNFKNMNEDNLNSQRALSKNNANTQQMSKNWCLNNDFLYFKNAWYVFINFIKRLLFKQNYNNLYAKHFNVKKTLKLLKCKYYWLAINQNMRKYVNACFSCHKIKIIKYKFLKQLQNIFMFKKSYLK